MIRNQESETKRESETETARTESTSKKRTKTKKNEGRTSLPFEEHENQSPSTRPRTKPNYIPRRGGGFAHGAKPENEKEKRRESATGASKGRKPKEKAKGGEREIGRRQVEIVQKGRVGRGRVESWPSEFSEGLGWPRMKGRW